MSRRFFATLSGAEEVPPVRTRASGRIGLIANRSKTRLHYRLTVFNLRRFTQAHLHLGRRGENGPVVVFLFGLVTPGIDVNRGVVTGTLRSRDLIGPLKGKTISDLLRLMRKGSIYVNVHTEQNPDGEIRGQVRRVR
ncbi:CHRD domain-containing protein [Paludifilum halophilum]|uniref:CHRD domain-containing protein n=1 Tax=Paludifilum halophilum TaxID=1642702 RepID=A0A235BC50_9BACL|nr:CHRD domain-containing protein [Paludifilum halophilum]OYD09135.1 CHRD domain-containing protein [Paludifilum halophilum]